MSIRIRTILALLACATLTPLPAAQARDNTVCESCIRADMAVLAGDALAGRACGADGEHQAAAFISRQLAAAKIAPAGRDKGYFQPVELQTPAFATPPILEIATTAGALRLVHGQDFVISGTAGSLAAPAVRASQIDAIASVDGKVLVLDVTGAARPQFAGRPAAVVQEASAQSLQYWDRTSERAAGRTLVVGAEPSEPTASGPPLLLVKPEVMQRLRSGPLGGVRLEVRRGPPTVRQTLNVLGAIHGTAADADRQAVLLSAHYDHLGLRNGVLYRGANDDASGTATVLELARQLGAHGRPRRTVYFALFGCEEEGGLGSRYFQAHPPTPLADLAANLEFEMVGARDPQHPDLLMMTGWERSNLGPTLAAHGARIGPDPYPQQQFFRRSDNYQLAVKGVVAHTISAWPIPPTYHAPSDDLAHLDLPYMIEVVGSLSEPIRWLVNSDFRPSWNPGGQP